MVAAAPEQLKAGLLVDPDETLDLTKKTVYHGLEIIKIH